MLTPLDLLLRVMTEADARQVVGWGISDLSDLPRLLDRDRAYYSVVNAIDDVVGCCCFGPEARREGGDYNGPGLDLAAWLRPDLQGFGRGARFVVTVLTFARALFGALPFRAAVPAGSRAAVKACRRAGFREMATFTASDGVEYAQLLWRSV